MLVTLISFFIVIAVLVLTHELGHFITARVSGVHVLEFGLGFPPRLLTIKRGETTYSLNAIPLGGFVKMAGEEDPKIPRSLASKSIGTRFLVLGSGSLMNFLLPLLLFSAVFMLPHNQIIGQVTVVEVISDSPAGRAGVKPGDTILQADDTAIDNGGGLYRYLQLNLGKEITLLVQHPDTTTEKIKVVSRWKPPEGQGATGIVIMTSSPKVIRQHYPFWQAIPMGVSASIETFVLFKNGIVSMIIGTIPAGVTGPVGIAQITGEVSRTGIGPLLEFTAFLSINLALINIFPLPALDGGRMAFVLVEWLRRGKRIPAKTEGLVHLIGFAALITFMLLVTYRDIIRIIGGDSLIP